MPHIGASKRPEVKRLRRVTKSQAETWRIQRETNHLTPIQQRAIATIIADLLPILPLLLLLLLPILILLLPDSNPYVGGLWSGTIRIQFSKVKGQKQYPFDSWPLQVFLPLFPHLKFCLHHDFCLLLVCFYCFSSYYHYGGCIIGAAFFCLIYFRRLRASPNPSPLKHEYVEQVASLSAFHG